MPAAGHIVYEDNPVLVQRGNTVAAGEKSAAWN
jgi:hypothetical protein